MYQPNTLIAVYSWDYHITTIWKIYYTLVVVIRKITVPNQSIGWNKYITLKWDIVLLSDSYNTRPQYVNPIYLQYKLRQIQNSTTKYITLLTDYYNEKLQSVNSINLQHQSRQLYNYKMKYIILMTDRNKNSECENQIISQHLLGKLHNSTIIYHTNALSL